MIGERNVAEELPVVVAVERAPTTVTILHAQQPLDAAPHRHFHTLRVGIFHTLQRHQHECRVVHIGKPIIAELKRPAAGLGLFVLHLPVARP